MSDNDAKNVVIALALFVIGIPLLIVDTLGIFAPISIYYWLEFVGIGLGFRWLIASLIYGAFLNWFLTMAFGR